MAIIAKIRRIFYLNYPQIHEVRKSDHIVGTFCFIR